MNLLLLEQHELVREGAAGTNAQATVTLHDWRARHIIDVLKSTVGTTIKTGLLGGGLGAATLVAIDRQRNTVLLQLDSASFTKVPPAALNCRVFMALPRPKAARRILRLLAECGVKQVHFFHCYKVEKSYWASPVLEVAQVQAQFQLGLSQAKDTAMPALSMHRLFKPFVEDTLPGLVAGEFMLLADPAGNQSCEQVLRACAPGSRVNIFIGPEGGLIPYELDKLRAAGASVANLGSRIYRSEVALALLLGQLHVSGLQQVPQIRP
ncbi:MAG: RsmE family RNA methyltransferase [Pseudomonadales bacterium]